MTSLLKYVERRGTDSIKWDNLTAQFGRDGLLPMWVADMDFQAPDCVLKALREYIDTGVFGYYKIPNGYYEAFLAWERSRHGYEVRREWLRFSPGVVSAVNWAVRAFTAPGDAIMLLTPVYYPFFNAVEGNGRRQVHCPLINQNGKYTIDYAAFEAMAREQGAKALILSSPHNPVGRVWTRQELADLLQLCRKLGIFVISDEIHQDFTFGGSVHTPAAALGGYDDMLITITAPSKTFNLATCQNSMVIIPNEGLRQRYDASVAGLHLDSGSAFGYVAAAAAYREGLPWLEELLSIIYANYEYIRDALSRNLPNAVVSPLEGTYLLWIDLSAYIHSAAEMERRMVSCGLAPDYGAWFGGEAYGGFIRLNLATSLENVKTAVEALVKELA